METIESLKDDIRALGLALSNLLNDIETCRIPTHLDDQGIWGAIDEANEVLHRLGFNMVNVTIREMTTPD